MNVIGMRVLPLRCGHALLSAVLVEMQTLDHRVALAHCMLAHSLRVHSEGSFSGLKCLKC